jgi:Holliday junction resolvase RusA-like endonuclease
MVAGKQKIISDGMISTLETWVFEIKLPYPPSLNKLYPTNFKTKRRFLSEEGKKFKAEVIARLTRANSPFFEEIDHVDVSYTPPDRRRRDEDNLHKAWQDAFTEFGVWKDDKQVKSKFTQMLEPNKEDSHTFVRVIGKIEIRTRVTGPIRITPKQNGIKILSGSIEMLE